MSFGLNLSKLVNNMLRGRLAMIHELSEVYKPAVRRNNEKIMQLIKEKAENASRSELAKKMHVAKGFYTLEMAPPSSNEELQALKNDLNLAMDFIKAGCFKYITVKQAWLLFLVCLEVGLWFFIGETIGKFHIVGYKV